MADLLNRAEFGCTACGLVLGVSEPREVKGTSKKGNSYHFFSRETQLFVGTGTVICNERKDSLADFPPALRNGSTGTFAIERARMDGSQLRLDGQFSQNGKG